jgi:hypothetical protein
MIGQIKESDWKIFKELLGLAQERFCQRALSDIGRTIESATETSYEKFYEIYNLVRDRDKLIAQSLSELRRSTATYQLLAMKRLDLVTEEEFARFSDETRGIINKLLAL